MLILLFTISSILVGSWFIAFLYTNDLTIPTLSRRELGRYKKVLLIFPHPDDEAFSTVGLISRLGQANNSVNWLILTKGEKGTKSGRPSTKLAKLRTLESKRVAQICHIPSPIFADYPDGELKKYQKELNQTIKQAIIKYKPDLVITYDQSGLYGHPDHIIVSKIVTQTTVQDFPETSLWYTSLPRKQYEQIILPEHMAQNHNFKSARKYPTHKIFIGFRGVIKKIMALYAYQSQFSSFTNELPNKHIPLWVYMLPEPFEYYYTHQ